MIKNILKYLKKYKKIIKDLINKQAHLYKKLIKRIKNIINFYVQKKIKIKIYKVNHHNQNIHQKKMLKFIN